MQTATRTLITALFLSCLLPLPAVTQAQELFQVSPAETDKARTAELHHALQQVRELRSGGEWSPVTVEIPAGRYEFQETLTLTPDLVGQGLTLKAAKAGEVTFAGGIALTPVEKDAAGFWRYRLPENWNQAGVPRVVAIAGQLKSAARYPNSGYFRIEKALPDRRSGFIIQTGDLPEELNLQAGLCDLILLHDWSSSRLPVASFDPQSRELRTIGPIGCAAPHYAIDHFEKQPRYWLEGQAAFADLPGEWYIDSEKQELVLKANPEDQQAPLVTLPSLLEILVASGTTDAPLKNLVLDGIVFTGARFPMPAGGLAGAQATMHEPRDASGKRTTSNRPMLDAAVRIERAENCKIQQCRFEGLGGTGLWLAGQTKNCVITRCRFYDLGGNGLNLGEDNSRRVAGKSWYQSAPDQVPMGNRVEQCDISFCGAVLPGAVGIWAPLNNGLQIVNNHLHDCPYTGISLGWIWNPTPSPAGKNLIQGNRIEFVMQVLSDGGGIYTLGLQPESVIENNIITDIPLNAGRAESNGMFLDEGSTGFTIRHNTIRRIDRSPVRFHKAGKNIVTENRWELATPETPPVRFNNTPADNITITNNEVLEPQTRIFLIGNSLTWDTMPSLLNENVHWHVDCGKSLKYISEHPEHPCVGTSRLWPIALNSAQYDIVSVQPHYSQRIEDDLVTIARWMEMQPEAIFLIHTGWARHETFDEEAADNDPAGPGTHSQVYYDELIRRLQQQFPNRTLRTTRAMQLLKQIQADIKTGKAPFDQLSDLYRDAIHMTIGPGRYLMHNQMRQAIGQPLTEEGFSEIDPEVKAYLNDLLMQSH